MRKINFLTLAFAILIPVLFASCNSKEDLVGNYEIDKDGVKTILGDNKECVGIKMSLNENDSATFIMCMNLDAPELELGDDVKVACDIELKGKWDYSSLGELTLNMNKAELKNFNYVTDDKDKQEALKLLQLDKITEEIIKTQFNTDEIAKSLEELKMNVSDVQEDGFILKGGDNQEVKVKRIK